MVAQAARSDGLLRPAGSDECAAEPGTPAFIEAATELVRDSLDVARDALPKVQSILEYPLADTVASGQAEAVLADGFEEVAAAVLEAHASGQLEAAIEAGPQAYKAWVNAVGKTLKRKGKRLFLPLRLALTGRVEGPEVGAALRVLHAVDAVELGQAARCIPLKERTRALRVLLETQGAVPAA